MLTKKEKEEIKYLCILKRKYENLISDLNYNLIKFEIAYGNYDLCKLLVKEYSNLLINLEETKRYYYEFCEKYSFKAIR